MPTARPSRPSEDDLQAGLVSWLRAVRPDCMWFAVPNGGKRPIKTAVLLKKMGVRAGVADLVFGSMPNCPLAYIELKTKTGSLSKEQRDFQDDCIKRGTPYHILKTDDLGQMTDCLYGLLVKWGALKR